MTMVERVARALCEQHGLDPDEIISVDVDAPVVRWTDWTGLARAAIEAMREPSRVMCEIASDESLSATGSPIGDDQAKRCWQAMIQAALEGEG